MLLVGAAGPAAAARSVHVTVDRKGVLRLSRTTLRSLGVGSRDGMVAVQFPIPPLSVPKAKPAPKPRPKPAVSAAAEVHTHGPECGHAQYRAAPKLFVPLRPDGSLEVRRQKVPGGKIVLPGPPGTRYVATAMKGRLVLKKP